MPPMKLSLASIEKNLFSNLNSGSDIQKFFSGRRDNDLFLAQKPRFSASASPLQSNVNSTRKTTKNYSGNPSDFFIDLLLCNIGSLEGFEQSISPPSTPTNKALKPAQPLSKKAGLKKEDSLIVSRFLLGDADRYEISINQLDGKDLGNITLKKNDQILEGIDQEFVRKLVVALGKAKGGNKKLLPLENLRVDKETWEGWIENLPVGSDVPEEADELGGDADIKAVLDENDRNDTQVVKSKIPVRMRGFGSTNSLVEPPDTAGLSTRIPMSHSSKLRNIYTTYPVESSQDEEDSNNGSVDVGEALLASTSRSSSHTTIPLQGAMVSGQSSDEESELSDQGQKSSADAIASVVTPLSAKDRIRIRFNANREAKERAAKLLLPNDVVDEINVDNEFDHTSALSYSPTATPLREKNAAFESSMPSARRNLALEAQYYEAVADQGEENVVPNSSATLLYDQGDAFSVASDGGPDEVEEGVVNHEVEAITSGESVVTNTPTRAIQRPQKILRDRYYYEESDEESDEEEEAKRFDAIAKRRKQSSKDKYRSEFDSDSDSESEYEAEEKVHNTDNPSYVVPTNVGDGVTTTQNDEDQDLDLSGLFRSSEFVKKVEDMLEIASKGKTSNRYMEALRLALAKMSQEDILEKQLTSGDLMHVIQVDDNSSIQFVKHSRDLIYVDGADEEIHLLTNADVEKYAEFLGVTEKYRENVKLLEWEKTSDIPSPSPSSASAQNLVETTLYKPVTIHGDSIWNPDKTISDRGNKLKVVNGVYGVHGEDDQNAIEQTIFDIIATVAARQEPPLDLEKVLKIIKDAREKGGIKNKWEEAVGENGHYDHDNSVQRDAKIFSKEFQKECEACGILSGRDGSNKGLRTTFIPKSITDELEKLNKGEKSSFLKGEFDEGGKIKDLDAVQQKLENRKNDVVTAKTAAHLQEQEHKM